MKIGVFDSGIGGLSVAKAIQRALPDFEIVFRDDREHLPYGTRTPEDLLGLVAPILEDMIVQGCQVIVIACNTVSTTIAPVLREKFSIPFIAMEPMIKPAAALTKTKVIAVCATPATLGSKRYQWLKDTYAQGIRVVEPDCSEWAAMIEHNNIDDSKISDNVELILKEQADVIVLGCTHYHWIEEKIKDMVRGRAQVIQPEQPVIEQLKRVIAQLS